MKGKHCILIAMNNIKVIVVKSMSFPNHGYSLRHNQQEGFKGITGTTWGWYRYKRDAIIAAKKLEQEWNTPMK